MKKLGAREPHYGHATSPLVDGDRLYIQLGEKKPALVALDAATGAEVWRAALGASTYSSPTLARLGGVKQLVTQTAEGLLALDPKTGEPLWTWRRESDSSWTPQSFGENALLVSLDVSTIWTSAGMARRGKRDPAGRRS